MKQIILFFGFIFLASALQITGSYAQTGSLAQANSYAHTSSYTRYEKFNPMISTIITPDKGKEMLRQNSRPTPNRVQKFFTLTPGAIDTLLLNFEKITSLKTEKGKKIRTLNTYGFQYIGVVIKNRKYIYINAFDVKSPQYLYTKYKNWQTEPVVKSKGGKAYWGVLFDIEEGKFYQLEINETA